MALRVSPIAKEKIRILLVDDQPAVRRGLSMRLALEPDIEVIGEAGDGRAAVSLAEVLRPHVVLMDVEMPGIDGFETTAALRAVVPESSIVILTLYDDANRRARAEEAGAAAFIAKHQVEEKLLTAVRCVTITQGDAS